MTKKNNNNNKNNQKVKQNARNGRVDVIGAAYNNRLSLASTTTRFKERERITTMPGTTGFGVMHRFFANPGDSNTFPWLSTIAAQYDKYVFHKLIFHYHTIKGANSPGNILLAFDFDSMDGQPTSAIGMTQLSFYEDGATWNNFSVVVPVGDRELFVRHGPVIQGDPKTYDLGQLFTAAELCADSSEHGYIEVEYDVELKYKSAGSNNLIVAPKLVSSWHGPNTVVVWGVNAEIAWDIQHSNPLGITTIGPTRFKPVKGAYLVTIVMHCFAGGAQLEFQSSTGGIPAPYMEVAGGNTGSTTYQIETDGNQEWFLKVVSVTAFSSNGYYRRIFWQAV